MKKKKLQVPVGTWFAVPLRSSGFAVGILARATGHGSAFGYFFGPKRLKVPVLSDLTRMDPEKAIWVGQFGDLGLLNKKWPVIGIAPDWSPEDWPVPPFFYRNSDGETFLRHYSENLDFIEEIPCDPSLENKYPKDLQAGYGAVEKRLTEMIDDSDKHV